MTDPIFCRIRVKGHLSDQWVNWFAGLEIKNQQEGEAVLSGPLPDQSALYGVLSRMRDLGVALISLSCMDTLLEEPSAVPQRAQVERTPAGGKDAQPRS
jgi:hypothetical protein